MISSLGTKYHFSRAVEAHLMLFSVLQEIQSAEALGTTAKLLQSTVPCSDKVYWQGISMGMKYKLEGKPNKRNKSARTRTGAGSNQAQIKTRGGLWRRKAELEAIIASTNEGPFPTTLGGTLQYLGESYASNEPDTESELGDVEEEDVLLPKEDESIEAMPEQEQTKDDANLRGTYSASDCVPGWFEYERGSLKRPLKVRLSSPDLRRNNPTTGYQPSQSQAVIAERKRLSCGRTATEDIAPLLLALDRLEPYTQEVFDVERMKAEIDGDFDPKVL